MSEVRLVKTYDEISLLNHTAAMVDAAYDELYRAMKPGMSENQAVGLVSKVLYDLGSEFVEAVNAISGDRKSTRLNSSHGYISYAVFCLKKKKQITLITPLFI